MSTDLVRTFVFTLTVSSLVGAGRCAADEVGRSPTRLRVVTYNLWHGMAPTRLGSYGPVETAVRRRARERAQAASLIEVAPAVTMLQECNQALWRAPVLAQLLDADYAVQLDAVGLKLLGFGVPSALNSGLATLIESARSPRNLGAVSLSHPRFNFISPMFSTQFREERFALLREFKLDDGRRGLVVNVHLHDGPAGPSDGTLSEADECRAREVSNLLATVAAREADIDFIILGGDFNFTPTSLAHRRLAEFGFVDAWTVVRPADPGFTFDPVNNSENIAIAEGGAVAVPESATPARLDYVWIKNTSGSARIDKVQLIGRLNLLEPGGVLPSDHFGIAVDLTFD